MPPAVPHKVDSQHRISVNVEVFSGIHWLGEFIEARKDAPACTLPRGVGRADLLPPFESPHNPWRAKLEHLKNVADESGDFEKAAQVARDTERFKANMHPLQIRITLGKPGTPGTSGKCRITIPQTLRKAGVLPGEGGSITVFVSPEEQLIELWSMTTWLQHLADFGKLLTNRNAIEEFFD